MKAPLTVPQTITLLLAKYPDGLVCRSCAKLLASRRHEGREYTCAECRSDAQESARTSARRLGLLEKAKTSKPARSPYLEVITKAAPQPYDQESLTLLRAAHRLEVEGEVKPGKGPEGVDTRVLDKKAKFRNRASGTRMNTGDSEAKSVTAPPCPPRRRRGPSDRRRLSPQAKARLKEKELAAKQAARDRVRAHRAKAKDKAQKVAA